MKLITAIIKPHKLDEVREALSGIGIQGITTTDVQGFGRQRGHTAIYRGAEYKVDFLPKWQLEIAVRDDQADKAIAAVGRQANGTGPWLVGDMGVGGGAALADRK